MKHRIHIKSAPQNFAQRGFIIAFYCLPSALRKNIHGVPRLVNQARPAPTTTSARTRASLRRLCCRGMPAPRHQHLLTQVVDAGSCRRSAAQQRTMVAPSPT
jgi:hypothetical protein